MSLLQSIKDIFQTSRLPLDKRTVGVSLGEPPALSHTLTVDRLQSILRSAEQGECQDLFAVYRDIRLGHAHSQTVINQRKLSVLTKALTIVAQDPRSAEDRRAADAAQILTQVPGWSQTAMNHLLNGHLYPLAVLEQVYEAAPANALGIMYQPKEWAAVPYHLLDWTDGFLQIWDADPKFGQRLGSKCAPHPLRHIVHRGHLLTDIPDNWGGPMRAALFWWLFAVMDRDWWIRFLDRFGAPFIVGRYDKTDTGAKRLLTAAFSQASRVFGLVVSRETDIAVHAVAANSHGEAYRVMQDFANAELSKLFIGQTMTVSAQAGGLGGAQAEVQDAAKSDIEAWDLTALAATVNHHIIGAFLRTNGIRGRAVLQVATDTVKELLGKAALLEVAAKIGLELTDEAIQQVSNAGGIQFRRSGIPAALPAASALPGATTTPTAAPVAAESVQSQAMNGAQVASLVDVIKSVVAKQLPEATALEVLKNAFPAIPEASLRAMLTSATAAPAPPVALTAATGADTNAILASLGQPTDAQLDRIATAAAPALAAAFVGRYAAVADLIAASTSAADLEHRLHVHFSTLSADRVQPLIEDALTAYAANGAATARVFP